jgi:hypothetical protein
MRSQRRLGGLRTQIGSRSLLFAGCYRKRVPLHTAQRFSPMAIMSPVHFTSEKQCYTVLIL